MPAKCKGLQQIRAAGVADWPASKAEANRLADTAALFQALGGGWWNRTDVATAASEVGPE